MKSLLLITLLMGVIFAQTATALGSDDEGDVGGEGEEWEGEGEDGEEGEEEEPSEEEHEPTFPTLICTLFGTQACNAGCLTVATMHGTDSGGYCDDQHVCQCQPSESASLEDLWGRKFDPKFVLPQIKSNQQYSEKVLEILNQPLKSTEETKQELHDVLPEDLHKKIRIKTRASSNIIPQADGKFNQDLAKKYTSSKLRPFINDQFPKGIDYKAALNEALQTSDEHVFQNLIHQVRLTQNKSLEKVVDDFLSSNQKQEEPQQEGEDDIIDFVDHHIINELIKSIETKPKPKSNQKPGTGPAPKSNTNRPPPRKTTTTTAPSSPHITHTVTSSSRSGQTPSTTPVNEYTLPDATINKQVIDGFQKPVDKVWSGPNFQVRFRRVSPKGDTEVWWSKGNDHVYLHRHADGAVDQNWIFGGKANIGLYRDVDKSQIQTWDFGNTRLDFEKAANSMSTRDWMYNRKDEESYKKYGEVIRSWCNANDFFVGREYCIIF